MTFRELVADTRSYRRFSQKALETEFLTGLVDLARQTPSGANRQPLKYRIYNTEGECSRIFPHTRWAGALKDWPGPAEGERPVAYISILLDTEVFSDPGVDAGIAGYTLMAAAREAGVGSCLIGAFDKAGMVRDLEIPERYVPVLYLALGYPAEEVLLEDAADAAGPATYYRDSEDRHHVPKRTLRDVLVKW